MNNRQLVNALKTLGDSPSTVRDTLLKERCLGYLNNGADCPVSVYLRDRFPEYLFMVGPAAILWYEFGATGWLDAMVDCPEPVKEFVNRFDDGLYPELVLSEA